MANLELNEVIFIHKSLSESTIKGSESLFMVNLLHKIKEEAEKLHKLETQVKNPPKK